MADTIPAGTTASSEISPGELALATRNSGMPLEALQREITPLGLHYLLIHYDIPFIDPDTWTLTIGGAVERPLTVSLAELQARPAVTVPVTLECAGNGRALLSPRAISQPWGFEAVGTAEWTGTPLAPLLHEAGVSGDAVEWVFAGADHGVEGGEMGPYERSLTLAEAARDDLLIAYAINGQPLPPQHGFPARLLVPGWYGMASVKWLTSITAVTQPFQGYQMVTAYRMRQEHDDVGEPLSRIAVRSLMVPPGVPEFSSRRRHVPLAACDLQGRAWSGAAPIQRVEVSADLGQTWDDAQVGAPPGPAAWHPWTYRWQPAAAGDTELWCRATDAAGNTQPLRSAWNLGGYAVNEVQRVPVRVGE